MARSFVGSNPTAHTNTEDREMTLIEELEAIREDVEMTKKNEGHSERGRHLAIAVIELEKLEAWVVHKGLGDILLRERV